LRVQILISTLVVGLIPIMFFSIVAALGLRNLATTADEGISSTRETLASELVTATLQDDADEIGRAIDSVLAERIDDIVTWARQPSVSDPAYLAGELERQGSFNQLSFHGDPVDAQWWQGAASAGVYVGPLSVDEGGQGHFIPIASRVTDSAGTTTGVVFGGLAIESLHEVADGFAVDSREVTIITADRQIIAETASNHDPTRVGADPLAADELAPGVIAALGSGQGSMTSQDGVHGFGPVLWPKTTLAVGLEAAERPAGGTEWFVVASEPSSTAFATLDGLEGLSRDLGRTRSQLAVVTGAILVLSCLACTVAANMTAKKLVAPVRRLTKRARQLADEDLTEAALQAEDGGVDFASLEDHSIDLNAGNELDELAASFDSVHRTAIRMTAEQSHLRQMTADMFANLGRRNQSLVKRQLRFIEDLERSEEDPDRLAALFKLDHLATRMRRNAESLLVIAGHRGASRRSSPVRIELVTQAALGEVENFERVDTDAVEPAAIMGRVVAGLAHVLAELIENALAFSPPETPVRIVGEPGQTHYTMSVIDRGIGLLPEELSAINERLAVGAPDSDLTSSKQLGLLVVAKLASWYGFRIRLVESAAGGVAATVQIPNSLVQPPELGTTPVAAAGASVGAQPGQPAERPTASRLPPASVPSPTPAAASVTGARQVETSQPPSPVRSVPRPAPSHRPARAPRPEPRSPDPTPVAPSAPQPEWPPPTQPPRSAPAPTPDRRQGPPSDSVSSTTRPQVTGVTQRRSRRTTVLGDSDDAPRPGSGNGSKRSRGKRAVATSSSGAEVAEEAADVRDRWNSFRAGQRTAAARDDVPPPDRRADDG
jgi:signal transduction histidine kinase